MDGWMDGWMDGGTGRTDEGSEEWKEAVIRSKKEISFVLNNASYSCLLFSPVITKNYMYSVECSQRRACSDKRVRLAARAIPPKHVN